MNHANTTPLADTWSHYFATLGACEIFMVGMALVVLLANGCFLAVLCRGVSDINLYEQERADRAKRVGGTDGGSNPSESESEADGHQ